MGADFVAELYSKLSKLKVELNLHLISLHAARERSLLN